VASLVHHLGRLEELGVRALHRLYELAAHEHGPVLAVEEQAHAPRGEAPVELRPVALAEAIPVGGAVDVDELVGQHALVEIDGTRPVDVARDVPLIPLGVLVEPAELWMLHGVFVLEERLELGGDGVHRAGRRWCHGLPLEYSF